MVIATDALLLQSILSTAAVTKKEPPKPRSRVVFVPNPLDRCTFCNALSRFGDFRVEKIRGTKVAVCPDCEKFL